jgi:TRAP-type C4-dicarboxylate transport system permease small subunit
MKRGLRGLMHGVENGAVFVVFGATIVLPIVEIIGRPMGFSLHGNAEYVRHLVMWLTFLGGMLAAREGKHLQLSTVEIFGESRLRVALGVFAAGVAASITAVLARASWLVVAVSRDDAVRLPIGLPEWVSECIMPVALAVMALRFAWRAPGGWVGRGVALVLVPMGFLLDGAPELVMGHTWACAGVVLAGAIFGAPVFAAMAGVAMVFYFADETPISAVSAEIYRLISSPMIPAIPLLTACGYLLAEAHAAERLVRFFKALFGWMPGGIAVLVTAL